MATFPSKVNYATGDILTATNMNDVGGAINLLDGAQFAAGKNKIINGDFAINQRAFTSTTTTNTYGFDRFVLNSSDALTTYSAQTFTPGAAPVTGYEAKNYARLVTAGQSATNTVSRLMQYIEDVRTFAGQTVTVSFWAQSGSGTPSVAVEFQQNFGAGGSPSATVNTIIASPAKQAISTSWARYSFTIAVPSISGKTIGTDNPGFLMLGIWVSAGSDFNARTGSLGIQSNTFNFWGVQVEAAQTASPFQTATGTKQGELAACQRYYWRNTPGNTYGSYNSTGSFTSTTVWQGVISNPVPMRIAPTSIDFANLAAYDGVGVFALTTPTITANQTTTNGVWISGSVTGATQYRPSTVINNNNAAGYIGFSAEL